MTRFTISLAVFVIMTLLVAHAADAAKLDEPASAILERHRIEPSLAGVAAFLRSLNPEDAANQPVHQLIAQLSSGAFAEREAATQKLIDWPLVPEACLADATVSPDREVRERADRILRRAKGTPQWQVIQAVFRTIRELPIRGAAAELLDARQWIEHEPTRAMMADVLTATAVPGDADRLRTQFAQGDEQAKSLLVGALAVTLHAQAPESLSPLLEDGEPRIRLLVVRTLLNLGERRALAALGPLLNADDLVIRTEAIALFQAVTGKHMGFVAYKDASERRTAVAGWAKWLDEQRDTIELKLPLARTPTLEGRITVCLPDANRVLELDLQGKLVEELQTASAPRGCERQPNGNWLVASYKGRHLAEYDASGTRLWEMGMTKMHDLKGPLRASRLANGNFLAPFLDSMTVAEVDSSGKIVWQVQSNLWPTDADRLENGNTLVTLAESGVVEYDSAGKIVWQIEGLKSMRPDTAQRLPNGNTLVALNKVSRLEEFDRAGRSVWSAVFPKPKDAYRMTDGSTVVADETGIKRIDHDGNLLWHYPIASATGIRVY